MIVQAPTGTGKTTRLPLALLEAGFAESGKILVLQPRRVAARATAGMMARTLGERVGETVGYQIRFDTQAGPKTAILVVTEGILSRRILSDPLLDGIACVVLDEFHERSLHTDLAIALVRELLGIREDLRLVVMSATLDALPLQEYLGHCACIHVKAPAHPLSIRYLGDAPPKAFLDQLATGLEMVLSDAGDDGGDVLVFLAGAPEIHRAQRFLSERSWPVEVVTLFGGMSAADQDRVLQPGNQRRIVLATNIAETSLTLPKVTAVLDSGWQKLASFDVGRGIDRLDMCRISQASAQQRAGRAGRLGPGRAVRMWSEQRQLMLKPFEIPDIHRLDLANFLLHILDFHGPEVERFPFFDPPTTQALAAARNLLGQLHAIAGDGRLTRLGKTLVRLPLPPRLGALLEKARHLGKAEQGVLWCALLSESQPKDGWRRLSDLEHGYQMDAGGKSDSAMSSGLVRRITAVRKQLWRMTQTAGNAKPSLCVGEDVNVLQQCLLAAYPDRVFQVRKQGSGVMVGGRGVTWEAMTDLQVSDLAVALDLRDGLQQGQSARLGMYEKVSRESVLLHLPVETSREVYFDSATQSVQAVERTCLQNLILEECPAASVDAFEIATAMAQEVAGRLKEFLPKDDAGQSLLLRLQLAHRHLPDYAWPDVSTQGLCDLLPQLCMGHRKLGSLKALDWYGALRNQLSWNQLQILDKELPERITVPSGSHIKINYQHAFEATGQPVLAVRLQECFGMRETPRLAGGKLPLLLHLLAPNMRPAQVTQDLENFWNTTYAEVRKELRQRYPKHFWPENPWEAQAVKGTKRHKP